MRPIKIKNHRRDRPEKEERRRQRRAKHAARDLAGTSPHWRPA